MKLRSHNKDANGRVLIKPHYEERHSRAVFKIDAEEQLPHCFVCRGVPDFTVTLEAHEALKTIVTLAPIMDSWLTLNNDNQMCGDCKQELKRWREHRDDKVKKAEERKKNPLTSEQEEMVTLSHSLKHMAEGGSTQKDLGSWLQRNYPGLQLTPKKDPDNTPLHTPHTAFVEARRRKREEREMRRTVLHRSGHLSYKEDDLTDHPLAGSDENEDD